MTSIGNDIVDLKTIDITRTLQPQFYSKILTAGEQAHVLYQTLIPKHHLIWLLWSLKEAAYKCLKRHQPDLVFSPTKIELRSMAYPDAVSQINPDCVEQTGFTDIKCFKIKLIFGETRLYARTIILGDEIISTIVRTHGYFGNVYWGIKKIEETDPDNQSAAVRKFLSEKLNNSFPGQTFNVVKDAAGVPSVSFKGKEKLLPVSLSHHGSYVSYAMPGKL